MGLRDRWRTLVAAAEAPAPERLSRHRGEEFGWLGDTGAAGHVQDGANQVSSAIADAVSAVLGVAGQAFSVGLAVFTVTFIALFFLSDVGRLKQALGSVLTPVQESRWLGVWERVTVTVSRWAIGVLVISTIAGATMRMTGATDVTANRITRNGSPP